MRPRAFPLLLALALSSGGCSGEDDPGSAPSENRLDAVPFLGAWHELVTDPAGGVLLVNGYPEDSTDPGPVELWRWDGEGWALVHNDDDGPSARNFAGVTVDPDRGELVLHGGLTPEGPSDETWTWDGDVWSRVGGSDEGGPGPRSSPSMAYDAASRRVLLYGGDDGATQYDDTWAWDGAAWTRAAPDGPTPVRWPAFLEQDPVSGSPVLYGGHQVVDEDGPIAVGDTWVWAGDRWRHVRGADQPGPLLNANGVIHPDHGLLLVGGADESAESGAAWRWAGSSWELLGEDVVPPRQALGLAYDEERDVVVLTGGLVEPGSTERHQDVWEWAGDPAAPAARVSPDE